MSLGDAFAALRRGMAYSQLNAGDQYAGRPVMNRYTGIDGHISVIGSVDDPQGEALYVNRGGHNRTQYDQAYQNMLGRARRMAGGASRSANVVQAAYDEVNALVTYSISATDGIRNQIGRQKGFSAPHDGVPIENWDFIKSGHGVCRHMALATSALLERAVEEGLLKGEVRYHRSLDTRDGNSVGHAWTRFTDEQGNRWIVDVAQRYCGLLQNAPAKGWNYTLDDEPRPAVEREYVVISKTSSNNYKIGEAVVTSDRAFKASDLDPSRSGRYSSYVAYTSSGNKYFVGFDASRQQAVVIDERDLPKGDRSARAIDGELQLRVGDPLTCKTDSRPVSSTPIVKIVAIGRSRQRDLSPYRIINDGSPAKFAQSVVAALKVQVRSLGIDPRAHGDARERVAHAFVAPDTALDLQQMLVGGDYRKAWIHTTSGNTLEVERVDRRFRIINKKETLSNSSPYGATVDSLDKVSIGRPFTYGNGNHTTEVTRVVVECTNRCTREQKELLTGGRSATYTMAAESAIQGVVRQPGLPRPQSKGLPLTL